MRGFTFNNFHIKLFRTNIFVIKENPARCTNRVFKSGRPGSNRRHSAWKADALPTELLPPKAMANIN